MADSSLIDARALNKVLRFDELAISLVIDPLVEISFLMVALRNGSAIQGFFVSLRRRTIAS